MIILITIILTICSSLLHSMEMKYKPQKSKEAKKIEKKWNKELICRPDVYFKNKSFNEDNIKKYSRYIDLAEKKHADNLMKYLIQVCLLPDIIEKHIDPYLSEWVLKKYKHKLIDSKYRKNLFTIKQLPHNNQWIYLPQHNGTYFLAPKTHNRCTIWNEDTQKQRYVQRYDNQEYCVQLISKDQQANKIRLFATLQTDNTDDEQRHCLVQNNTQFTSLYASHPISNYLFSNDNTLLALTFAEHGDNDSFDIYTMEKSISSIFKTKQCLNGAITALSAAHHSPVFIIGSSKPYVSNALPNLVLIKNGSLLRLDHHDASIISVEFSPDDKRLLSCSYDKKYNKSDMTLWNVCNGNTINDWDWYVRINDYNPVIKAFFIDNGAQILAWKKYGGFDLYNGITATIIKSYNPFYHVIGDYEIPITLWSKNNKIIINTISNSLKFYSETGTWLGCSPSTNYPIVGMGLTADENNIIYMDENDDIYQIPLFTKRENTVINSVKRATFMQLFSMLHINKHHKKTGKKITFIKAISSYIREQQKKTTKK